jgi:hypothetical protein
MNRRLLAVKLATGIELGKIFAGNDLRKIPLWSCRDRGLIEPGG